MSLDPNDFTHLPTPTTKSRVKWHLAFLACRTAVAQNFKTPKGEPKSAGCSHVYDNILTAICADGKLTHHHPPQSPKFVY